MTAVIELRVDRKFTSTLSRLVASRVREKTGGEVVLKHTEILDDVARALGFKRADALSQALKSGAPATAILSDTDADGRRQPSGSFSHEAGNPPIPPGQGATYVAVAEDVGSDTAGEAGQSAVDDGVDAPSREGRRRSRSGGGEETASEAAARDRVERLIRESTQEHLRRCSTFPIPGVRDPDGLAELTGLRDYAGTERLLAERLAGLSARPEHGSEVDVSDIDLRNAEPLSTLVRKLGRDSLKRPEAARLLRSGFLPFRAKSGHAWRQVRPADNAEVVISYGPDNALGKADTPNWIVRTVRSRDGRQGFVGLHGQTLEEALESVAPCLPRPLWGMGEPPRILRHDPDVLAGAYETFLEKAQRMMWVADM